MSISKKILTGSKTPNQERAHRELFKKRLAARDPFFAEELEDFLAVDYDWCMGTFEEFAGTPAAWRHLSQFQSPSRVTDGLAKSLDLAEGFAFWALIKRVKPRVIVELGVYKGLSARLWKAALNLYVPDHRLVLCDLEDRRELVDDREAEFFQGDARQTLPVLWAREKIDLLYNDAHPYSLIEWSVQEGLKHNVPIFAFHDTGHHHPRGPYRPSSAHLSRQEKLMNDENWGEYGTWERHVLGEIFDQRALDQEAVNTKHWKIRHFDSFLGASVVLSRELISNG